MVRALTVALVLLVMVSGARAADQGKELAKAHVRKATAAYNLGKYAEAAKEYEAAYEQTLDPNLLFNVAQACRLAGDREKAIMAYRSFIRSAPDGERRRLAESKIRELEQQRLAAPPTTNPVPGAGPAPSAAAPTGKAPVATPAPPVVLPLAASPGSAAAATPSTTQTSAGLVTAPAVPEPIRPAPFYKRWPFWTGVGVAVVAAVVLTVVFYPHSNDVAMKTDYGTQGF
jgi:hypothetical protein